MGTRNLTVVKSLEGETKIALYGQWDGYPSHSGIKALEFLRDRVNRDNLLVELQNVEFIDDEEANTIYEGFDSTDWENKDFLTAYPGLHRDTGVGILEVVANSTGKIKTVDNTDFANDSLFCEGIYEVDFSSNSFISRYHGTTVEFDLDSLPTDEEYLASFENDLTNA
jgi:DNA polymerase III epsilon subunit-like protein